MFLTGSVVVEYLMVVFKKSNTQQWWPMKDFLH